MSVNPQVEIKMPVKPQVEARKSEYYQLCRDCGNDIPENTIYFKRLHCKCKYHAHCLVLALLREGVNEDGTFRCRYCLMRDEDYYDLLSDSEDEQLMSQ